MRGGSLCGGAQVKLQTNLYTPDEEVELSWFDADGNTLFRDAEFDPREWAPPGGSGPGDPRVHRFIGLYHSEGIESLVLFNAEQVDHLQYGYSIPEPTSNGLLALAAGCFLLRRKRARHDQDGEEYDPSPSCLPSGGQACKAVVYLLHFDQPACQDSARSDRPSLLPALAN